MLEIAKSFGLSETEYSLILTSIGREPNMTEIGIFSVMWSEHCSYKSSKVWLQTLPTKGPSVICGPGENAGIIDIGDGDAIAFKIESHNHPSFIEPYQGAATGVGGILRDVFTMGARPIALMNSLSFGSPEHPRTKHLISGVVSGIGGYGNCIGVPTVGGECRFDESYNGNILVNAMCVGLVKADQIFFSTASGIGNLVIYVGAKTGRDGIHGATMASAEFSDNAQEKRPTVQVGDPFTEKLLLEACLELMETGSIVAIQDMGAAGLTSSSVEMAGKGGLGIELDLDLVPIRETGMTPYEIMLSESQERMLIILSPGTEEQARQIFEKWELDLAVIGRLTDTGHLVLRWYGEIAADLPLDPLVNQAPLYEREWTRNPKSDIQIEVPDRNPIDCLRQLVHSPNLASRRWIWEQYDHLVRGATIKRPGGDAAVVRINNSKAIAITTDCIPRYCRAHPVRGGHQAVAESWRNLTSVGALPIAITNCLNFGNPEKPEIMGEFVDVIQGIREACINLNYPVVSGNVSLYNETNGVGILPTPVIGGIGVVDAYKAIDLPLKRAGNAIIVVGRTEGHLGQSLYLREIEGRAEGLPPLVNLRDEFVNGNFVRDHILNGHIVACHDCSDGGLLVTLAEMAMAGGIGASIASMSIAAFFGEDQARYIIETPEPDVILTAALDKGIAASRIGVVGGDLISIKEVGTILVSELRQFHESWFPEFMNS